MTHSYISGGALGRTLRRLGLMGLLAGGTALAAQAQFTYTTTLSTNIAGTYTDLGTNGTAIATANTDDANSAAQPIGFSFTYNGTAFTQFVLNTNGLIRLGANAPSSALAGSPYAQAPDAGIINSTNAADVNLLMPFSFDLTAGTSTPEYRVYTTGATGSRICTIQWKNVADKAVAASATTATTIPTQYTNFSFQVKLYEANNQIDFVYNAPTVGTTDGLKYAVVGLKGSDNTTGNDILATKASTQAWSTTVFFDGPEPTAATQNAHNFRSIAPPDAGRTYRFVPAVPNDAAVFEIDALGKLPTTALPSPVQAVILNSGTTALTNVQVTLTVTGANSYTAKQTIAAIAIGDIDAASFTLPSTFVRGVNTLTVTIANDGNNTNNSLTMQQTVNSNGIFSYIPSDQTNTLGSSVGAVANTAGTSSLGAVFASSFTTVTGGTLNTVRVYITDVNSVGRTVQGVVLNAAGAVIGSSANYTIVASDINAYHQFAITTPPTIASGATFAAGLSQAAYTISTATPRYFPVGYQAESGVRAGTFLYYAAPAPTGSTTPTDLAGYRFMIEATLLNALPTSPELQRAVTIYPNPSATGVFNLDIHNANAGGLLGVEVVNQLGQRVYTGSAHDNFTNSVDLSNLAAGLYHLQVRNGEKFTSHQISIVK